jgi:hypothetical protein
MNLFRHVAHCPATHMKEAKSKEFTSYPTKVRGYPIKSCQKPNHAVWRTVCGALGNAEKPPLPLGHPTRWFAVFAPMLHYVVRTNDFLQAAILFVERALQPVFKETSARKLVAQNADKHNWMVCLFQRSAVVIGRSSFYAPAGHVSV